MNAANRTKLGGMWAPDRNDEYLFYQTLAGTWPAEPEGAPAVASASEELTARLSRYMQKAAREAKVHTSWIDENQAYGSAVARFVERTLRGRTAPRFLASFLPIQRRLAYAGMRNALAQLVLKLASPGVPDFYQGCELWNLDLVDPDNRRPVDYELRRRLLAELEPALRAVESGDTIEAEVGEMSRAWHDARIKLFVTACGVRFRRGHPELMLEGGYLPLDTTGPARDQIVAFARVHEADALLCAVPRLAADRGEWHETHVALPAGNAAPARFRHLFTGARVDVERDGERAWLRASDIFRTIPVALLIAD
jgi:(1->4)-alpha-D-glucan 1-alpha-D-glucosylmutase